MKLSITTWQRFQLIQIVGNAKGNLIRIRKANKALDILEMTDEEKKQVGYVEIPNGARWKDSEHRWDLEIKDKEAAHIVRAEAERFSEWPVAQVEAVLDLAEQLGIGQKEVEDEGAVVSLGTDGG